MISLRPGDLHTRRSSTPPPPVQPTTPTRPAHTAPGERPSARAHACSRRAHTVICTPSPPHTPTLAAGPAETPVTSAYSVASIACRAGGWRNQRRDCQREANEGTRGASSQRRTAPPTAAPRAGELASAPVRRMPQAMRPALTVIPTESAPPPTSRAADHPTRPVRTAPGERPSARAHARSRRAHTVICTPSPPHKPTLAAGPAETPVTSAVNRVPARGRGGCRGGGEAVWWRGGHLHLHGEPPPRIEGEACALARQLAR